MGAREAEVGTRQPEGQLGRWMSRIDRRVREGWPRGPTPASTAATTTGPTSAKSSRRDPGGASSGPRGGPGIGGGPAARGDGVPGRHPVDLGAEGPLGIADRRAHRRTLHGRYWAPLQDLQHWPEIRPCRRVSTRAGQGAITVPHLCEDSPETSVPNRVGCAVFYFRVLRSVTYYYCCIGTVVCICDDSETEGLGSGGREPIDCDVGRLAQQPERI